MSRGSITQRITLVLLGGMLCLLAVLVLYVWQVASTARSDSRSYALSLSESITQSLEEKTASITKTASSLAQNAYVEAYYASDDINERAKNIRVFNSLALNAIADRPDILAVGLLDLDGSSITVGTQLDAVLLSTLKRTYPFLLEPDAFSPFFTRAIRMEGKIPYYAYILPVYDTRNKTPLTRVATCVVLCDLRRVQSLLDQTLTAPFCDIRLYDSEDILICSRTEGAAAPHGAEILTHALPSTGWSLRYHLDFSSFSFQGMSLGVVVRMALICAAMLLIVFAIVRRSVARPVDAILARLRSGKDLSHLGLHFGGELDIIVETIERTFARLERTTQERIRSQTEVYAMQLHLRESELSALQSQINPHFLYNTLECMRSIGLYYESPEIVSISTAMADIFRYSIKGSPMVALEEELRIIRQYMNIIDVRFDGRFHAETDCTPETLSCIIPKMILQPLVENAIYHGLEPQKGDGMVTIRARLHNEELVVVVQDDGIGMAPEEVDRLRAALASPNAAIDRSFAKRSIGLANIAQRIRLFSRDRCAIEIRSRRGEGTSVCIRLPSRRQDPSC